MSTQTVGSTKSAREETVTTHENHTRENIKLLEVDVQGMSEQVFVCKDCGNGFTRAKAAKPLANKPEKCAACQRRNRADAKAKRNVQEVVKVKDSYSSSRYTFTLSEFTNIAIDTLAVGKDRSVVVEEAIVMMLSANPEAKSYAEYKMAVQR